MNRKKGLSQLANQEVWDLIIIGGGATGLGIALDSALRGYSTLLIEKGDFAQGTSSKSTKLVHGGVRYLKQGEIRLVREALKERGLLIKNAPHLVHNQTFIIPFYKWYNAIIYSIGLRIYDLLSGRFSFGWARNIDRKKVIELIPEINSIGLKGGITYQDGSFDDTRLAINLAQSAVSVGATLINYLEATELSKNELGKIIGLTVKDHIHDINYKIQGKKFINACGVFSDAILKLDDPNANKLIRPSQGIHLVMNRSKFIGQNALMIPQTNDGRVLFMVPWHSKVILGTTDTPVNNIVLDPLPLTDEIDFILNTAKQFLNNKLEREDILSCFVGLRPLAAKGKNITQTKGISRSHKIWISPSGLVNIIGGKWTTYRRMAEDTLDTAFKNHPTFVACSTENFPIHGSIPKDHLTESIVIPSNYLSIYGSDSHEILKLAETIPGGLNKIHPDYPYLEVEIIWAVRNEMAQKLSDILARRIRLLFLDVIVAKTIAPKVARIMAIELGRNSEWEINQVQEFYTLAGNYEIPKNTHDLKA